MIGISACLIGVNCTYRGNSNHRAIFEKLFKEGRCIAFCPEVLGGLPTPRTPSEVISDQPLKVVMKDGKDVTHAYQKGAQKALAILQANDIDLVVLKSRSPSCGVGAIYDGTFSGTLVDKDGVTARFLKENGVSCFTEEEFLEEDIFKWDTF